MIKVKKGFTLIELIITLAILGIMLSAVFMFFNFNTKTLSQADFEIELQRAGEKVIEQITNISIQSSKITQVIGLDDSALSGDISGHLSGGLLPIKAIVFEKNAEEYKFQLEADKSLHLYHNLTDTVIAKNIDKLMIKPPGGTFNASSLRSIDIKVELGNSKSLSTQVFLRNYE